MHVFKHEGRQRRPAVTAAPPAATGTYAAPRHHREVPSQVPSSPGHSAQPRSMRSPGGTAIYPWGEHSTAAPYNMNTNSNSGGYPVIPNTPFPENQTQNASSSSYAPAAHTGALRWLIIFDNNTQNPMYLPAERFRLPQGQCYCGTNFRFVHLPTIAAEQNWRSEVGVLWNFIVNQDHGWVEGRSSASYVSQVTCPVCRKSLGLLGPYPSQ